ncbi:hypothetical protein BASA83_012055 [Batrachochytrium salamandrivorans]|nr:hypothetical protein BASA83_012055 [Batrachochytrium salamandrivorans]
MRVGAGIILSVLSSSVLAAVIPNYGDHVPLLVRRTVNPENRVVLWKRADEKQTGPGPSNSGAGASSEASTSNGQSNPDDSGINSELKKLDRFQNYVERLYKSHNKNKRSLMQRMAHKRDKKSIKIAIKIVAEITKGENRNEFILIVKKLLTAALESTRTTLELFNKKAKSPLFSVFITKGKTQKTVNNEMVRIQGLVTEIVKEYLKYLTIRIAVITKTPQHLTSTINGIARQFRNLAGDIKYLYAGEYKDFISKVEPKNNEKNIQIIEKYLSEANEYWKSLEAVADYNQNLINNGKVTFTKKASKKTSTSATRVKKRPGMKTKPPTDETPDQETSDQGVGQSVNGIFG